MNRIVDVVTNPFLITGISSWLIAQVLKVIIHTIIYKKFDIKRFFGDGGMPSGHSATVCSLAVMCALICGTGGIEFAMSVVLALIVCHDAMGVRLETGKQAVLLNEIIESFNVLTTQKLPEVKLKEFVGHTPVQVMSGAMLGVINAFVMYWLFFV